MRIGNIMMRMLIMSLVYANGVRKHDFHMAALAGWPDYSSTKCHNLQCAKKKVSATSETVRRDYFFAYV